MPSAPRELPQRLSEKEDVRRAIEAVPQPCPPGITNFGHTCYINSTLQCILSIHPLVDWLIGRPESPRGSNAGEPLLTPVLSNLVLAIFRRDFKTELEDFREVIGMLDKVCASNSHTEIKDELPLPFCSNLRSLGIRTLRNFFSFFLIDCTMKIPTTRVSRVGSQTIRKFDKSFQVFSRHVSLAPIATRFHRANKNTKRRIGFHSLTARLLNLKGMLMCSSHCQCLSLCL